MPVRYRIAAQLGTTEHPSSKTLTLQQLLCAIAIAMYGKINLVMGEGQHAFT
jgi:hypothetical protein